jgi:pimeloyl-ACP methyl ester carboxylesterase
MQSKTRGSRATQPARTGIAPAQRRSLVARLRQAALLVLGLLALLVLLGASYQAIATASDARRFPPPGQLVDVGGYRLHLYVQGADRGGPTVLLDAGQGSASPQWGWVQRELAAQTRVVSIDRPGMGYSDPLPPGVDARRYVADLRAALASLDLQGPYVLVAHSMGALTSRAFAAEHPDEVAGVVLVDPRDLDIVAFSSAVFPEQPAPSAEPTLAERWLGPLAARLGVMRLANMLGTYVEQLPADDGGRARAMLASTGYWDNFLPDALLGESAVVVVAAQPSLGDVPLIVLSAGEPDMGFPPDSRARFIALHEGLAQTLSSRGRHVLVPGADHFSIVTDPQYAQMVSAAAGELLAAATPTR